MKHKLTYAGMMAEISKMIHDIHSNRTDINVIDVVHVADWPAIRERDESQQLKIDTQDAHIARLRMLLKEALAQLGRIHETNKSSSPDFKRLSTRAENVLSLPVLGPSSQD